MAVMNQPCQSVVTKRPGRGWWIATAVAHGCSAVVFAGGIIACVNWLHYVNTDRYVAAHQDAADFMLFFELLVLGLIAACGVAVAYSCVGLGLSLSGYRSGPTMFLLGAIPALLAGVESITWLGLSAAASFALPYALLAHVGGGLVVASMACGRPQRPPRNQQVVRPVPPPYSGGSPYLRPPGS